MKFSRQEYMEWLWFPILGDLPEPRIEPTSIANPALASLFFTTEPPEKQYMHILLYKLMHIPSVRNILVIPGLLKSNHSPKFYNLSYRETFIFLFILAEG